jgi:hypothetical protein
LLQQAGPIQRIDTFKIERVLASETTGVFSININTSSKSSFHVPNFHSSASFISPYLRYCQDAWPQPLFLPQDW